MARVPEAAEQGNDAEVASVRDLGSLRVLSQLPPNSSPSPPTSVKYWLSSGGHGASHRRGCPNVAGAVAAGCRSGTCKCGSGERKGFGSRRLSSPLAQPDLFGRVHGLPCMEQHSLRRCLAQLVRPALEKVCARRSARGKNAIASTAVDPLVCNVDRTWSAECES